MPGGPDKNVRHNNTSNNTKKNNDIPKKSAQKAAAQSSSFSSEKNEKQGSQNTSTHSNTEPAKSEKGRLRGEIGRSLTDEQFERGYECYLEAKEKQDIRNPAAWITTAGLKQFTAKKDESRKIKAAAEKIERQFAHRTDFRVEALSKFLEISYPGYAKSSCFSYENRTFASWWADVAAILGKYGMPKYG